MEIVVIWKTLELECQFIIEAFVQFILPLKLCIFKQHLFSVVNFYFSLILLSF